MRRNPSEPAISECENARTVGHWLAQNWYLVIPWITGIGAWVVARRRRMEHSVPAGVVFFLLGCLIVLAIDLAQ